jgi:hypothetical protein
MKIPGLPDIPNLGPMLQRGVEALERLADAQEHANQLTIELYRVDRNRLRANE